MSEQNSQAIETQADPDSANEQEQPRVTDNVGDTSVEINIDELIAEFESERAAATPSNSCARKRLEEILEERRAARELEDMDDFDFDFDLDS